MVFRPAHVVEKVDFPPSTVDPSTKIIELYAPDAAIGKKLVASGYHNYLGLVEGQEKLEAVRLEAPEIAHYFQPMPQMNRFSKHNANILILSSFWTQALRECLGTGHVEAVWWRPRDLLDEAISLALCLYKQSRGRAASLRLAEIEDTKAGTIKLWMANRYPVYPTLKGRMYIDPRAGLTGFFQKLDSAGIRYVVLRWFEDFPYLAPGEDVDLLVHDEDLSAAHEILEAAPGVIPCDVYSVSGYPGSDYDGMAYYPPYLADAILRDRVRWKDQLYVPSPEHHFLSLAYHVAYHKAGKSGLPPSEGERPISDEPEHAYSDVLLRLADGIGRPIKATLEDLHETLQQEGWSPAADTIRRLAQKRPWLSNLVPSRQSTAQEGELHRGEAMVFVAREWAVVRDLTPFVISWLDERGLDVLKVKQLTNDEQSRVAQRLRGGNWAAGPWPVSGGPPSVVIVAYDYEPTPVPAEKRAEFPNVTNGNFFLKGELRDEINRHLSPEHRANPIHSSDDEVEAWEYLEVACPEFIPEIRSMIAQRQAAYRTPQTVLQTFEGYGTRAKVELITYKGQRAVRKTFKHGRDRFLAREVLVYGELSRGHRAIPPLLEHGENYLIIPWYREIFRTPGIIRNVVLRLYAKEIISVLRYFYNQGFALIDFRPANALVTLGQGLRVIDFEHLYKYSERPKSFRESYDITGVPLDFDGDLPYGYTPPKVPFERDWRSILGARLEA